MNFIIIRYNFKLRKMSREISEEEVAQHNKDGDCWIVIEGAVLDVSEYMAEHPGGSDLLLNESGPGKDATDAFDDAEHSKKAKNLRKDYQIGVIKKSEKKPEPV